MHLPILKYVRASDPSHAARLLREFDSAELLAGGQHVLPAVGKRPNKFRVLVDVSRIPILSEVFSDANTISIGAGTRLATIADQVHRHEFPPLLSATVRTIANPTIRHRATLGGNIAAGHPQSQLPASLIALQAVLQVENESGQRRLSALEFFEMLPEARLALGEIITRVIVRRPADKDWAALLLVRPRTQDYPVIGLTAVGQKNGSYVEQLRLVFFGGGEPIVADAAAARLAGQTWSEDIVNEAQQLLPPFEDWKRQAGFTTAYRRHIAGVLLQRICAGEGQI